MSGGETTEDQGPLLAYLGAPGVLADDAPKVKSTHGAHIFLAGRTAYKLKRAVRYDYMDFGTKAKRNAAVAAELDLNRRTAPTLYLGVLPVYVEDGEFRLGALIETADPDPDAVANLVVMRRFDDDATFDRLAETGRLSGWMVDQLAGEVAAFHVAASPVFRSAAATQLARVSGRTMSSILARRDVVGEELTLLLNHAMQGALVQAMSEVDARGAAGCIKRLHGDLHLGNVALVNDAPVIFDALEFDDAMATVDTAHDIAFLVMDLWERGYPAFAARTWSRYLAEMDDYSGIGVAPLFVSMRAAVRAKVLLDAASLADGDARIEAEDAARAYVRSALAALDIPRPRLVAIGGLSGAGKTTVARAVAPAFAPALGAVHLRSDALRKRLAGVPFEDPLPVEAYRPSESAAVYEGLLQRAENVLRQGGSVILDAVFAKPEERAAAAVLAESLRVPFEGIWLEAPLEERQSRIAQRTNDASDATVEVAERQASYDLGDVDWRRVVSDANAVARIREALASQAAG